MSKSKLNELKSGIKNSTEVSLKISSNVVGDSNDENNFPHKLLLTNTQVSKLCKTFANGSSANIKLSKIQLHKIGQSVGFWVILLGPLPKARLPLKRNVHKPSDKTVLIPSGLTATAAAVQLFIRKCLDTKLITSNVKMNHIMEITKYLEESELLIKGVSERIKNEAKEQKKEFLGSLLGTLGASLLGNLFTGKGTIRAGEGAIAASQGREAKMPGQGTIRAHQDF